MKHEPAKRTEVQNLIRSMLESELKIPTDLPVPLINLGLGILFKMYLPHYRRTKQSKWI